MPHPTPPARPAPAAGLPPHTRIDLRRLRQVDLNLLLVLRTLLETTSVSETARRLDSSQPTVSRMLERLRRELDDPLLVKSSNAMVRTARASALRPVLDQLIEVLQEVYRPPRDYRLADEHREALLLVVLEGLSYEEAAHALDIPIGTLMSRLSRARAALRSLTGETAEPRLRSVK